MPTKPLESYERVPYRGTHYVEAAALDEALAQIARLKGQATGAPAPMTGAAVPADEAEGFDETSDDFKALEAVATKLGCATLDDLKPQMILDRFDAAEANAKQLFDDAKRFYERAEKAEQSLTTAESVISVAHARIVEFEEREKARNEAVVDKPTAT